MRKVRLSVFNFDGMLGNFWKLEENVNEPFKLTEQSVGDLIN